ncbi:hypothetical protein [Sodalis praecaptivus]|uniref:hypothetical protein n=1 Tax=Sodalis praecaptivus TaxID=1239307 RepID=UPI0031F970DE
MHPPKHHAFDDPQLLGLLQVGDSHLLEPDHDSENHYGGEYCGSKKSFRKHKTSCPASDD